MITLTILDRKTRKAKIETFISLDEATKRGESVLMDSKKQSKIKAASYDTDAEKSICESLLKRQQEIDKEI